MTNTISDFKDGFNGGTRANRFSVDISWPSNLTTLVPDNTLYHVIAAKLPEAELGSISIPYRGRVAHYAGDRDYKPWTVTILDDTGNNASWLAFQSWSNLLSSHINNVPDDQTYKAYGSGNLLLKTLTFKQLRDPSLGASSTTGTSSSKSRIVELYHAWPSEVGQIGFDMGEGGSLVAFTVTFTYDYYNITQSDI